MSTQNGKSTQRSSAARLRTIFVGGSLLLGTGVALVALVLGETVTGFLLNLGTELIGAALLYIILDVVIGRVEAVESEQQAEQARQQQLREEMSSRVPDVAKRAAEQLRQSDAWFDGSLRGIRLDRSDFSGANLAYASMREAQVSEVNFTETILTRVDFKESTFESCNFKRAQLTGTFFRRSQMPRCNFSQAKCQDADFRGCILRHTDFSRALALGADFRGADLSGATLRGMEISDKTRFDDATTLPDGTPYRPGLDMTLYTEG